MEAKPVKEAELLDQIESHANQWVDADLTNGVILPLVQMLRRQQVEINNLRRDIESLSRVYRQLDIE